MTEHEDTDQILIKRNWKVFFLTGFPGSPLSPRAPSGPVTPCKHKNKSSTTQHGDPENPLISSFPEHTQSFPPQPKQQRPTASHHHRHHEAWPY